MLNENNILQAWICMFKAFATDQMKRMIEFRMETALSSDVLVSNHHSMWHKPENHEFYLHYHENLKYCTKRMMLERWIYFGDILTSIHEFQGMQQLPGIAYFLDAEWSFGVIVKNWFKVLVPYTVLVPTLKTYMHLMLFLFKGHICKSSYSNCTY